MPRRLRHVSSYGNRHGDISPDALTHRNFDLEFIYVHNSGWKSSIHDSNATCYAISLRGYSIFLRFKFFNLAHPFICKTKVKLVLPCATLHNLISSQIISLYGIFD
ncbi:hypothetical protein MTR_5g016790 [Medicago truncatula]|uniref:Uncharacterized protein n=1 Tax=Medicago truncatula TaxID=3880 RepID=G7K5B1_MEDTR|nr:hypothetical protein MTR_5g016790 [Medicago truncatula]